MAFPDFHCAKICAISVCVGGGGGGGGNRKNVDMYFE